MGKDSAAEPDRRLIVRTIAVSIIVAVVALSVAVFVRLTPLWSTFSSQLVTMLILVFLLWLFFVAFLVGFANYRELGRSVSGWLDVMVLLVVQGVLSFLILADLVYFSVVILLCLAFIVYLHAAQPSSKTST
jgi:hypothetical protein